MALVKNIKNTFSNATQRFAENFAKDTTVRVLTYLLIGGVASAGSAYGVHRLALSTNKDLLASVNMRAKQLSALKLDIDEKQGWRKKPETYTSAAFSKPVSPSEILSHTEGSQVRDYIEECLKQGQSTITVRPMDAEFFARNILDMTANNEYTIGYYNRQINRELPLLVGGITAGFMLCVAGLSEAAGGFVSAVQRRRRTVEAPQGPEPK